MPVIICIQKGDVIPCACCDTCISCCCGTSIFLAERFYVPTITVQYFGGAVRRTVIDCYYLQISMRLRKNTVNRLRKILLGIVYGNDYADQILTHSGSSERSMVILYPLESYVEGDCRSYMGTPEKDFRASGLKSGRGPRVFGVRMHAVIRQPKSQN